MGEAGGPHRFSVALFCPPLGRGGRLPVLRDVVFVGASDDVRALPLLHSGGAAGALADHRLAKVRVGPEAAVAAARVPTFPDELRLEMAGLEPVWRVTAAGKRSTISAADGSKAGDVAEWRAHQVAQAYAPGAHLSFIRLLQ